MAKSPIIYLNTSDWIGYTYNPWHGCTKIGSGCRNCYALACAKHYHGAFGHVLNADQSDWSGEIKLREKEIDKPASWKDRHCYMNSMTDMFHRSVLDRWLDRMWLAQDAAAYKSDSMLLMFTKRWARSCEEVTRLVEWVVRPSARSPMLVHSYSTQSDFDRGFPHLMATPGVQHGISFEPLLEHINIESAFAEHGLPDWLTIGCESNGNSLGRPCHESDIGLLRDTAAFHRIPCFVKQIGIDGKLVHSPDGYPQEVAW